MSELYEIMNAPGYELTRLRDELAKAQADRDEWKRRYDTACAHVEVDCEEAAKEAVAEMKPQLEKAKADVAALSKDVMPRSEFADLLEERDSLREWRDQCYAAWKERDALKADVAALKVEYESRAIWIAKMCAILDCENKDGFHCKDVHEEARKLKADVARLRAALENAASFLFNSTAGDRAREALAATAPAPVDDAGTVEGTLAAAKAIVDSGVLDRVLGKPAPVVPLPDMNSSTTEPAVSSKDLTVPLEDAEALAKAVDQLLNINDYEGIGLIPKTREVLAAYRAKHPAPVAQACDAH